LTFGRTVVNGFIGWSVLGLGHSSTGNHILRSSFSAASRFGACTARQRRRAGLRPRASIEKRVCATQPGSPAGHAPAASSPLRLNPRPHTVAIQSERAPPSPSRNKHVGEVVRRVKDSQLWNADRLEQGTEAALPVQPCTAAKQRMHARRHTCRCTQTTRHGGRPWLQASPTSSCG
jgi:hypothetical protein